MRSRCRPWSEPGRPVRRRGRGGLGTYGLVRDHQERSFAGLGDWPRGEEPDADGLGGPPMFDFCEGQDLGLRDHEPHRGPKAPDGTSASVSESEPRPIQPA